MMKGRVNEKLMNIASLKQNDNKITKTVTFLQKVDRKSKDPVLVTAETQFIYRGNLS